MTIDDQKMCGAFLISVALLLALGLLLNSWWNSRKRGIATKNYPRKPSYSPLLRDKRYKYGTCLACNHTFTRITMRVQPDRTLGCPKCGMTYVVLNKNLPKSQSNPHKTNKLTHPDGRVTQILTTEMLD